jgi:hypothetical protein
MTMRLAEMIAVMAVAALACSAGSALAQDQKPNILFILADNLGYGELGPMAEAPRAVHPRPRWTSSRARVSV